MNSPSGAVSDTSITISVPNTHPRNLTPLPVHGVDVGLAAFRPTAWYRRERKATELGQEPPESALKGDGVAATLMLRLADGSRVRRRFLRSDTMGKVLDWADVQGVDLESQRLSSTFPKVRSRALTH